MARPSGVVRFGQHPHDRLERIALFGRWAAGKLSLDQRRDVAQRLHLIRRPFPRRRVHHAQATAEAGRGRADRHAEEGGDGVVVASQLQIVTGGHDHRFARHHHAARE
jgi:hypothetical protein